MTGMSGYRAILSGLAWRYLFAVPLVIAIALAAMADSAPLRAHALHLFAGAEGERITGHAYFSNGTPAPGAAIEVITADGTVVSEATADSSGDFSIPVSERADFSVVASLPDGHRAAFLITADELTSALPMRQQADADAAPAVADGTEGSSVSLADPHDTATLDRETLEAIVDEAVARQVRPLRQDVHAYQAEIRMRDVLGGLGYILGIAGVAFFVLGRRQRNTGTRESGRSGASSG